MSYSDDTAEFMFSGLHTPPPVTRWIIHSDGLSSDEMLALVAEYEKEWESVLITERKDLAEGFKTAYMVELRGGGSVGERQKTPEPTPHAKRSLRRVP